MTEEIWKDIEGYEGSYQVSNTGLVRSLDRRRTDGVLIHGRMLAQSADQDGYLVLGLSLDGKSKTVKVHRLVAKAFIDNPDNLPEVNHIDEDKTNNNVDNLEWCTNAYNLTYGHRLECVRGERAPHSKLTAEQVDEIRRTYIKGDLKFGQSALGKKYGVSHPAIACIVKNKTWRHLLKEEKNDP